nr:unnamed protein product [Callosobruchus chinensis]
MAAVFLEDFYKPFFSKKSLTNQQTLLVMKCTVITFGAVCLGMVYVIEKLGTILQLTLSMGAVASGPSLGLFTMGVLMPWINAKVYLFLCLCYIEIQTRVFQGALAGGIVSLVSLSWLCYKAQSMISAGTLTFKQKPLSTEECSYLFTPTIRNLTATQYMNDNNFAMPKRKRASGQKKCEVKKLSKKLKKIQEKLQLLDSSDSSSTTSSGTSDSFASDVEDSIDMDPAGITQIEESQMPVDQVEIDFDLFGNKPLEQAQIGSPIHNEIALRWSTILQAGLTAGERTEIMEKSKIPANCLALIPPKTNEEIQPCLPEAAAKHDKFIIILQTQLAHSLSAIGAVINQNIMVAEQADNIKTLGEACKLIANVHNALSVHRKYKIIPHLHPDCAKVAKTVKMDEQLFEVKPATEKEELHQGNGWDIGDSAKISPVFKLPAYPIQGEIQRTQEGGEVTSREEDWTQEGAGISTPSPQVNHNSNEVNAYAGRLSQFSHAWKTITNDSVILRWVQGIHFRFHKTPKQRCEPKANIPQNQMKDYLISVNNLLQIGAISKCIPIKVQKKYRKYLRFKFMNRLYEFNSLPFGLNIAPFIFTKVLKQAISFLRKLNILLVFYLDNILLIADSKLECEKNVKITIDLLENLGFIINKNKSMLKPRQTITFLGFSFNSVNMTISLPEEKVYVTKTVIQALTKKSQCTVRTFAQLIGRLVAACPATKYGFAHLKVLERVKHSIVRKDRENYNKKMEICDSVRSELSWWEKNIGNGQDIKPKEFNFEIFSDASPSGWGAFCTGRNFHGFWDEKECEMHINFLEIKAAYYALKSLTKNKTNIRILLRIDNQTAISCINRGGSVKFQHLNKATKLIWEWCENKNISAFASYVASSENFKADKESRSLSIDTEYELNHSAFSCIIQKFGEPEIDLFASRINNKCKKYISWFPDPNSCLVDAFTTCWSKYYFYAFPPFACIARVLEKIIQDKGPPSPIQEAFPGGREIVRLAFQKRGIPASAIPTIVDSISNGTLKQYATCFKKYWDFCKQKQHADPLTYNLAIYLEFLSHTFEKNISYAVINSYRSALNLIFSPTEQDLKCINRFLKGVANIRPPKPKYSFTWNPDSVLLFLKTWYPLISLSLEQLTYKLVFLMAISSASRIQTLTKIKLSDISKTGGKIEIRISEKIKTSAPNKIQPLLIFPYFREAPELCVAQTIEAYLEKTSKHRNNYEYLILTHKKPFHPATSQTISRWLKITLNLGGIDTEIFSGYSTRHAATSAASRKGVNVDLIRHTADWTPSSNTFFKFYNRPLIEPRDEFAKTVLNICK